MRYIGKTKRTLKDRISEHIGYINTKKYQKPAGEQFNSTGHIKTDMKVLVLKKCIPLIHSIKKNKSLTT